MDLVTIRLPIGKEVKTMGDRFITALYVVVMTVLVVFVGFGLVDKAMVEEVETYSTGFEISHMELSQKNSDIGFISVRNDEESATLTVDKDLYAGYTVGEVVEVETVVMEYTLSGDTYTEHRLVEK